MMTLPVIVLGSGGHAKVLIDILKQKSVDILGITVPNPQDGTNFYFGINILGNDDAVFGFPPNKVLLVNGIGSVRSTWKRMELYTRFKNFGYTFATIIHPSTIISSDVTVSEGVQIMAGAIVQTGSFIGSNTILNTKATVDHDCFIGEHVHLAPGVTISGGVYVDMGVHVGTGATIIQGMRIGRNSCIGAGALVINHIKDNIIAYGVPAKEIIP